MDGINVDIGSIKQIKDGVYKLKTIANKGFFDCERALACFESEIESVYQQGCAKVALLDSEISRIKKEIDAKQAEYERQKRESEAARAADRPYCIDTYEFDSLCSNAAERNKQLEELKQALGILKKQMAVYKPSKEEFITLFREIAGNGNDSDLMVNVIEKTIAVLDELRYD